MHLSRHRYDLGLIGPALLTYQRDTSQLDTVAIAAIVGSAKLGAVVGTFIGGACMLYYGRQPTIALSGIFFVVGPALMAALAITWVLIIGRLLIGLGIGISAVAIPAYLGEISPAKVGRVAHKSAWYITQWHTCTPIKFLSPLL